MFNYVVEIVGFGCEIVSCELDSHDMIKLKQFMKESNRPLEDILTDHTLIHDSGLSVDHWYELDDICHIYGAYPRMCRLKVSGGETTIFNPLDVSTCIDDFYSLTEFDSIYTIMDKRGILVRAKLTTKELFDINLLTLLITKVERETHSTYIINGFTYGDEYLKLESVSSEEIKMKTYLNKTVDDYCTIT
jgi:hypothetical protein